jgi:hypothetical protein
VQSPAPSNASYLLLTLARCHTSYTPLPCPAGLAEFILYPGTKHGFAVRGNKQNPAVNAARADALQQGVRFFAQHLAAITPPAQRLDASAPAPVGKRIVLAPTAC